MRLWLFAGSCMSPHPIYFSFPFPLLFRSCFLFFLSYCDMPKRFCVFPAPSSLHTPHPYLRVLLLCITTTLSSYGQHQDLTESSFAHRLDSTSSPVDDGPCYSHSTPLPPYLPTHLPPPARRFLRPRTPTNTVVSSTPFSGYRVVFRLASSQLISHLSYLFFFFSLLSSLYCLLSIAISFLSIFLSFFPRTSLCFFFFSFQCSMLFLSTFIATAAIDTPNNLFVSICNTHTLTSQMTAPPISVLQFLSSRDRASNFKSSIRFFISSLSRLLYRGQLLSFLLVSCVLDLRVGARISFVAFRIYLF